MKRILATLALAALVTGCATLQTAWRRADSLNPGGGGAAEIAYRATIGH